jgi:hypothetical protein
MRIPSVVKASKVLKALWTFSTRFVRVHGAQAREAAVLVEQQVLLQRMHAVVDQAHVHGWHPVPAHTKLCERAVGTLCDSHFVSASGM